MNTHDKFKINDSFTVLLILCVFSFASAQEDLFSSIREESEATKTELLPRKMVFTQRLLWSENGLMRKTQWSPLTIEQREKELKIRRKMLKAHQFIGFVTLAGMIAQGVWEPNCIKEIIDSTKHTNPWKFNFNKLFYWSRPFTFCPPVL